MSNIMKRRDAYRISVRLSHVCETVRPPSQSPKASANLSTHWTISRANRSAVAFASTIVYTKNTTSILVSTDNDEKDRLPLPI